MPDPARELDGRVAVVTGGARGIGRAVVHRLRAHGARVAALDLHAPDPDEPLDLPDLHLEADVTDERSLAEAVAQVASELGPPRILVNNAGVNAYFEPAEMTSGDWDRFFAIDLKASWLCARAVLGHMRAQGGGAIVNVSSIHGRLTLPGRFPYAAAKAGLAGLTRSLALEVARDGIRVNAVSPGLILTRLSREGLERGGGTSMEEAVAGLPLGRGGEPLEVADLVAFLVSDRAAFITAADIPIDGGVGALLGSI